MAQGQCVARTVAEQIAAHTWAGASYAALQQLLARLAESAAPGERRVAATAVIAVGTSKAWQDEWLTAMLGRLRSDPSAAVSGAAYETFCSRVAQNDTAFSRSHRMPIPMLRPVNMPMPVPMSMPVRMPRPYFRGRRGY